MIAFALLITLLTFVANIVGTISGFGVSTIMTPILLFFLNFPETILLVCIIHWFHDVWRVGFFWRGIDWRLLLYFGIPTIVATYFGARLVSYAQSMLLSVLLGLFLIVSVALMYLMPRLRVPYNWITNTIGGVLSGFFAGIFGIRGAVRSVFLTAFDLRKATFVGTTAAISFLLDSTRFITYVYVNNLRIESLPWWTLTLFVGASFFGSYVGYRMLGKIPQEKFRFIVAAFLFVVGVKLLITPLIF